MNTRDRPEAILFDWDNTLVDTWPVIHDAINHVLAAMGHPGWTLAETRERVKKSMRDSFPPLFGARWEEAAKIFYQRFEAIHMVRLAALPGAEEMLAGLHAEGIYLGIVSNKTGHYLRAEAEHLGWSAYFGALIGATDAARDKPAADPIHMALAPGGIKAGPGVWYAGDTDTDLECANNAGVLPVLLREREPGDGEFDGHPPAWYFSRCGDLHRHLTGARGGFPTGP